MLAPSPPRWPSRGLSKSVVALAAGLVLPPTLPSNALAAEETSEAKAAAPEATREVAPKAETASPETAEPVSVSNDGAVSKEMDATEKKSRFGLGVVPALSYSSDSGFGYGVLGTVYRHQDGFKPYKWALTVQIFLTTRWLQDHYLRLDWLDVAGLPLRLTLRGGYRGRLDANFCGYGDRVSCDTAIAEAEADARSLTGTDRDDFVRRYYLYRYVVPNAEILGRWRLEGLSTKERRFEVVGGWLASHWRIGQAGEDGPYPGSLYEKRLGAGENGFFSELQLGVMVDTRDNEPAPTSGYWIEGSVRGASRFWGSAWDYAGGNITARGYLPLIASHRLVLAGRFVLDGMRGSPPLPEMVRLGGSLNYLGFGGDAMGRGIRERRFVGKARAFEQTELRWTFSDTTIYGTPFSTTVLTFVDVGFVAAEWDQITGKARRGLWGTGAGLRLAWDRNFIIRLDFGFSPHEDWSNRMYLNINNLF